MSALELPDQDDGMLRMSIVEHMEELRARIIRALVGFGVAYLISMIFANQLWELVQAPGRAAFKELGEGGFIAIDPFELFSIVWMWTPLVAAIFLAAPWVIYQAWAFIAPGLYPRERRWAIPFILSTAGLFAAGGLFAYFVVFRYALIFLLAIGRTVNVTPMISIDLYFTRFVNVMLGVAVTFELPVAIFFLTLIRVASPGFLLRHSRYAILAIVILASILTPSPDAMNMAAVAVPMTLLYFLGVFASFLLVMRRENRRFPWRIFFYWLAAVFAVVAIVVLYLVAGQHYHFVPRWLFLAR